MKLALVATTCLRVWLYQAYYCLMAEDLNLLKKSAATNRKSFICWNLNSYSLPLLSFYYCCRVFLLESDGQRGSESSWLTFSHPCCYDCYRFYETISNKWSWDITRRYWRWFKLKLRSTCYWLLVLRYAIISTLMSISERSVSFLSILLQWGDQHPTFKLPTPSYSATTIASITGNFEMIF